MSIESAPAQVTEFDPLQYAPEIEAWAAALADGTVLVPVGDPQEESEGIIIQEVETPAGLAGAAAIVSMYGKPDGPHYHSGEEVEAHYTLWGSAHMAMGPEPVDGANIAQLSPGKPVVVPPETTHFIIPDGDFSELVVSLPSFDEDNLKDPDANHPYDEGLHELVS